MGRGNRQRNPRVCKAEVWMARNPLDWWTLGLRNARMGAELLEASQSVIAHRQEVLREAARNPMAADYAELWLMGAEKIAAFTAAGAAAANDWAKLQRSWLGGSPNFTEAAARSWKRAMTPIHAAATANARRLKAKQKS
jgi:hypothetical protein